MSDVSITAANVVGATATARVFPAGQTITAGQSVYLDSSVSPAVVRPSNALTNATTANSIGIALNGGSANQPIAVQGSGTITNIGGTMVAGQIYVASGANAGGIAPCTDLTTGWFNTILGVAVTTTQLQLNLSPSGIHL